MMNILKTLDFGEIDFDVHASQQFATVIFDRLEDAEKVQITVIKNGRINQLEGENTFNPSIRRHATCVYVKEEYSAKMIKICTIQHKGSTLIEVHVVPQEEANYLLNEI